MTDLYATIYVGTDLSSLEVSKIVAECVGGTPDPLDNIEVPELSVSVRRNPDMGTPGFGRYGLIIEFEPVGEQKPQDVADRLAILLRALWARAIRTETSCDYEDLLPHKGRFDDSTNRPIVYGREDQ